MCDNCKTEEIEKSFVDEKVDLTLIKPIVDKKAAIYGVATFYTQFRLNPIGKHLILQCQGTACHVNGSKDISKALTEELEINPGETTKDGLFTIEDVACLGCCSLAPVIMINGEAYGNLTPKEAVKIVRKIKKDEEEVI